MVQFDLVGTPAAGTGGKRWPRRRWYAPHRSECRTRELTPPSGRHVPISRGD